MREYFGWIRKLRDKLTRCSTRELEQELRRQIMECRPGWDDYFMGLAFIASRRSHDTHTKHGCCLVDDQNRIVGLGYNGFPRGMDDRSLPLLRPDPQDQVSKYPWIEHSEPNAIANCTIDTRLHEVRAYVTGQPCFGCAKTLVRHNIKKWYLAKGRYWLGGESEELKKIERLVAESGVEIVEFNPNLDWMFDHDFLSECANLGYVDAFYSSRNGEGVWLFGTGEPETFSASQIGLVSNHGPKTGFE